MMILNLSGLIDQLKISGHTNSKLVWDPIRKKRVHFTPEEMVRQLFILYLINTLGFNSNRIAVEKEVKLERKLKRFDLIVYRADLTPYFLIECKSTEIALDERVIAQVVRYNRVILADYLGIVNGKECHVFKSSNATWIEVDEFPPHST